jgi:hypothetical protein
MKAFTTQDERPLSEELRGDHSKPGLLNSRFGVVSHNLYRKKLSLFSIVELNHTFAACSPLIQSGKPFGQSALIQKLFEFIDHMVRPEMRASQRAEDIIMIFPDGASP